MDKFQHDDSIQVFISTDAGGTGLNLQSATVLINLDMPWNPAVLDQRIAISFPQFLRARFYLNYWSSFWGVLYIQCAVPMNSLF